MSSARLKELIRRSDKNFAADKVRASSRNLNTKPTQPYSLILVGHKDKADIPHTFRAKDDEEAISITAGLLDLKGEMTVTNFSKGAKALVCGGRKVFP